MNCMQNKYPTHSVIAMAPQRCLLEVSLRDKERQSHSKGPHPQPSVFKACYSPPALGIHRAGLGQSLPPGAGLEASRALRTNEHDWWVKNGTAHGHWGTTKGVGAGGLEATWGPSVQAWEAQASAVTLLGPGPGPC